MKPEKVSWKPDRRNLNTEIALGDDPHYELSATSDGFRVEMGSLTIEMDAANMAQAKAFAETTLEWVWTLDEKLAAADRALRMEGARTPSVRPPVGLFADASQVPVRWMRNPDCPLCLGGLVIDPSTPSHKVVCGCVKAVL